MDLLFKDQNARPTVEYDFRRGVLPYGFTFTRIGNAWDFNADKNLEINAENVPRFDHDPVTGESLGLLLENQVTEQVRYDQMAGAVVGSPGTLPTGWDGGGLAGTSRDVVGLGTENGVPYIDLRFYGTTTSNMAANFTTFEKTTAATSGEVWTTSVYCKMVGGSQANINKRTIGIDEHNGGVYLTSSSTDVNFTTGGSIQRVSHTRTLNNAETNLIASQFKLTANSGVTIDITIRFFLPQLELGSGASSPIPADGSTVQRNKDSCVLTNIPWFNQNEGTIIYDFIPGAPNGVFSSYLHFSVGDAATNRICIQRNTANNMRAVITSGGSPSVNMVLGDVVQGTKYRIVFAWDAVSTYAVMTGGTLVEDTSVVMPVGVIDRVRLGAQTSIESPINAHHRLLKYYNRKVSQAEANRLLAA